MDNDEKIIFSYSQAGSIIDSGQKAAYFQALENTHKQLTALNMARGGNNISGFVFEALDTADTTVRGIPNGTMRFMENNNGPADFKTIDQFGNVTYQQAKMGYHGTGKYQIDLNKYPGQTFVVDHCNKELANHLERHGMHAEESMISQKQAEAITMVMKSEARLNKTITGKNTAPITSALLDTAFQMRAANQFALKNAKGTAAFTAGFSFGNNMYELMEGNMEMKELLLSAAHDTALSFGSAYVGNAASYLAMGALSNTAAGAITTQAASVIVNTSMGSTLVMVGNASVAMSAAMGPIFILGMAIGAGYATIKLLKNCAGQHARKLSHINHVINEALESMEQAQKELCALIDSTYTIWNDSFESGFLQIRSALLDNDFELLSSGLDTILNVFGETVMFKTLDEFDDFFFDNNSVLTL